MKTNAALLGALLLFFIAGPSAFPQSTFGSIVGTVQDPSGSSVPGANILVTDLDASTTRSAVSASNGLYQFLNLKPGRYSVKADKPGFATAKLSEMTLDARQERRLDLTLGLANVTQSVIIEATGATINTENATIANTMNNQTVTELPANYRGSSTSPLGAIVGLPNVQQDQNGNIALTGSLSFMTDYSVDGA
jgi:Carboxypeptidase regulatory-like domain